jgi:CIC family chloride channel protein
VVGKIFHDIMPSVVTQPGAFVVVGMAGFFTAVSNTPISTIIFVSEMTNSYHLLLPSLLVCSVAYMASGAGPSLTSRCRARSIHRPTPAIFLWISSRPFRSTTSCRLVKKVTLIPQDMPFLEFKRYFSETKQHYFPVMDEEKRLVGIFSSQRHPRRALFARNRAAGGDEGRGHLRHHRHHPGSEDLNAVLQKFTTRNIDSLPVVREDDHGILLGMLNRREVIAFYNQKVDEMKSRRQLIIPPGVSHAIQNTGGIDNLLVAFNTEPHDSDKPDLVQDVLIPF